MKNLLLLEYLLASMPENQTRVCDDTHCYVFIILPGAC